jgi:Yip1 domain
MANTATLAIVTNIFTSPGEAFAAIKERPSPWLPLGLILLGYCAVSFLYLNAVDLPWLMDQQLQQAGGNLTDAQRTQAVEAAAQIPPAVYASIGAGASCLAILIVFALVALYYTGVSFATNSGIKYKQWFALIAWCSLPIVFGLLAAIVFVLVSDVRFVPQQSLNPLSFGNLLAIDPAGAPTLQRVLLQLDPTTIWSIVLSVFGYQSFTQRSTVHAALVVLAPLFVIVLLVTVLTAL